MTLLYYHCTFETTYTILILYVSVCKIMTSTLSHYFLNHLYILQKLLYYAIIFCYWSAGHSHGSKMFKGRVKGAG